MKFIKKTLLTLFIFILIAFAFIWFFRAKITSYTLSQALHTPVHIEKMDISWGKIIFYRVNISHPKFSAIKPIISAKTILIDIDPYEIFNNPTKIKKIHIDQIGINLASPKKIKESFSKLLTKKTSSSKPSPTIKEEKTFILDKLLITNIRAYMQNPLFHKGQIQLPKINRVEFHDIGSNHPLPWQDLISESLRLMIETVQQKQSPQEMIKDFSNPKKTLKKFWNDIRKK